ncbi:MAG: hypothetical protein NT157_05960, partial [Candidatus Micrarchaeota archaeon]|nr:hypothetical protein [Candidatus Micrarchaeota archaeon]
MAQAVKKQPKIDPSLIAPDGHMGILNYSWKRADEMRESRIRPQWKDREKTPPLSQYYLAHKLVERYDAEAKQLIADYSASARAFYESKEAERKIKKFTDYVNQVWSLPLPEGYWRQLYYPPKLAAELEKISAGLNKFPALNAKK